MSLISLLCVFGCTKNSLEIEVEQDACKRFKINSPSYQLLEDPCSDSVKIRAEISFQFNRSPECLQFINNSPVFYQANNSEISALRYSSQLAKTQFTINGETVSYVFEAEFVDLSSAQLLNHIILDLETENELGIASNSLQIRINTACSTVDPASYNVNSNEVIIPRNQSVFTINLWDNASEDGDIVSVYLNGFWLIENHSLLNAGTDFNFSTSLLNNGANDLVVFALNEGSSGPNTVSIAINGKEIESFNPGLLTGEAVRINF